jgi:hypothetical protein
VAIGAGGCSDSATGPDRPGAGGADQTTPDGLIRKLEMAYEDMHAGAYLDCLAEDFAFFLHPDDLTGDIALPEYWLKQDEEAIHQYMFGDETTVESIELTLNVISTDSLPGDDPDDPSDDLWEYLVDVELRIAASLTLVSSGTSLFIMRRSPDHDDTVWQILEHHDLGDERAEWEGLTWTTLKLAFGGPATESLYPVRSSPENTLRKLDLAYERMDAEAYLDCLGEDLVFYLNPEDIVEDPTLPPSWGKTDEALIHGRMFGEGTDVERVRLTMTNVAVAHDEGHPDDPLDDVWTHVEDVDLRVRLPSDLTLHAAAPCEFIFEVDPDETGHGGQLLWDITIWYDLPDVDARSGEPFVEDASWGTIKYLYR